MTQSKITIELLLLVITIFPICADEIDYNSAENVLRFADHLFETDDYRRAIREFERHLKMSPIDADATRKRIGEIYRDLGDFKSAIRNFEAITDPERSKFEIGFTYFLAEDYEKSITIFRQLDQIETKNYIGLNYLMIRDWERAIEIFDDESLKNFALRGRDLPRKSPIIAGTLSAIFPGLGRFYVGRSADAINSITIVGLFGWLTYDGFRDVGARSKKGWFFGTATTIFYIGNVYGSTRSAIDHNRNIEDQFLEGIDRIGVQHRLEF